MNNLSDADLQTNLEQGYYNGNGVDNLVANNILNADTASRFHFAEIVIDGKNHLVIVTPAIVGNGPGKKYKAEAI